MRIPLLRPVCFAVCTAGMLVLGTFNTVALAAPAQYRADQRADRWSDQHRRFGDHDRQVVQGWYAQHRRTPPPGLRDRDRLDPDLRVRISVGGVLDRDLRRHAYAVPADLRWRLPPAPRGDRYYFVDGQLCLVGNDYRVEDVIRISGR
jgi:Ni/Co efflux regulator RcnB